MKIFDLLNTMRRVPQYVACMGRGLYWNTQPGQTGTPCRRMC